MKTYWGAAVILPVLFSTGTAFHAGLVGPAVSLSSRASLSCTPTTSKVISKCTSRCRMDTRRLVASSFEAAPDHESYVSALPAIDEGGASDDFLDFLSTRPEHVLPELNELGGPTRSTATARPHTDVPSYRSLLAFAGTTILIWLSEPCLSLVDTAVVGLTQGATSVVQLAAMGPATTAMDSLLYMTYFLALATTNLVSENLARKDYRKLQQHTSHVLGVATAMGLLVTLLVFTMGTQILTGLAGSSASTPHLIQYARQYALIRAVVAPLSVLGMCAQTHALACHDKVRPIVAVLAASIINTLGDLWLAPHWGVAGAAAATAAASSVSSLILLQGVWKRMKEWRRKEQEEQTDTLGAQRSLVLQSPSVIFANDTSIDGSIVIWRNSTIDAGLGTSHYGQLEPTTVLKREPKIPFLSIPDRKSFMNLVKLSGPLMFNMWAKIGAYSLLTVRATDFGVVSMAAHNVLMRIFFFFGCFADSLGATAQAFLPATLYPRKDSAGFQNILQKLSVLAVGVALFNSQVASWMIHNMGGHLAKDASIVHAMKSNAHLVGWSLMLHPLIVAMEGTVIATRNFRKLILTYAGSLVIHGTLLFGACNSFSGVWGTLVGFQIARLMGFAVRSRTKAQLSESSSSVEGVSFSTA